MEKTAKRPSFLRRTKATSPPDTADTASDTVSDISDIQTTTNKYTKRGGSRFKPRPEKDKTGASGGAVRNERPVRNFVRRRIGGANATSPVSSSSSSTVAPSSASTRRPFRVASRRRLSSSTTSTTTAQPTTASLVSEESFQDIGDTDAIEDPLLQGRSALNKTDKIQRRPLFLKEVDQNPSATNEEERKRHSKKYSSSFKQNQLDEVLKQRRSQEEIDGTTEGSERKTTVEDLNSETAVAIAVHQLLSAPIPSIPNYDDESPTKKSHTTQNYKYTSPEFADDIASKIAYDEYSSTPIYKTSTYDYQTSSVYTGLPPSSFTSRPSSSTFTSPKATIYTTSPFTSRVSKPEAFSTPTVLTLSRLPIGSTTPGFSRSSQREPTTADSGIAEISQGLDTTGYSEFETTLSGFTPTQSVRAANSRQRSTTVIPVPVEDYSLPTREYSSLGQEPAYFTREYLLESPVTKTYDDEYQYLSPITTPQTSTRKPPTTFNKKISTTIRPTQPSFQETVTTQKPRRGPSRKPFEKVPVEKTHKSAPKWAYRPVENYDYYDEGDEKVVEKYAEGTKVILHSKGNIECLDIGNFPHPTSCKKFISCARLENGSFLGWEYVCPKGLSFDPVGGICNWSAGLGCDEKDL